MLKVIHIVLP